MLGALVVVLTTGSAAARTHGLGIVRVAHFDAPVYATAAPGEPGKLYVVEQAGRIVVLERGQIRNAFFDIRPLVLSGGDAADADRTHENRAAFDLFGIGKNPILIRRQVR